MTPTDMPNSSAEIFSDHDHTTSIGSMLWRQKVGIIAATSGDKKCLLAGDTIVRAGAPKHVLANLRPLIIICPRSKMVEFPMYIMKYLRDEDDE